MCHTVSVTRDNASENLHFDISAGIIQTNNGGGLNATTSGNTTILSTSLIAGNGTS